MNTKENEEFTQHLRAAVREAEELGYRPHRFKGMLNADGGYETVKRILASGKPSEGFTRLLELDRVRLTCEAIVVESRWRPYFDEDLLERSETLLRQVGYEFSRFEGSGFGGSADDSSPSEADDFTPPDADGRDFALREVALRPWQGAFRDTLFERYGRHCCISECAIPEALEAAHITAYVGEHSNDPRNGLVLRSDLHTLFDRYLFGIEPASLCVVLSDKMAADSAYKLFNGRKLVLRNENVPSTRALEVHWRKFSATLLE